MNSEEIDIKFVMECLGNTMSLPFWRKWQGFPVSQNEHTVTVAFVGIPSTQAIEAFGFLYARRIVVQTIAPEEFESLVVRFARGSSFHQHEE
jgi:hypothetical protein